MHWKKIMVAIFLFLSAIGSIFSFSFLSQNDKVQKENQVVVEILGHVKNAGKKIVDRGTPLSVIIAQSRPLFGAKLDHIDLNTRVDKNTIFTILGPNTLTINFKKNWNNFKSLDDFLALKLSKRVAQILWNLKQDKGEITWAFLASTPGIGKVTIEKLKNYLILE